MADKQILNAPALSSNRTFMELKFESGKVTKINTTVLIVPLWNWNMMSTEEVKEKLQF